MMKWFRRILRGASATAVLFMFQACYGTPQVPYEELEAEAEAAPELVEEVTTEEISETEDESAVIQTLPE